MKPRTILAAMLTAFGVGCSQQTATPTVPPEGLAPTEAIKAQLGALQRTKDDAFLTIEEAGGDAMVQVSSGGDSFALNIAYYPSKDAPETALGSVGITVPETWEQVHFEPGEALIYNVPAQEVQALPVFINDLFVKFFKRATDYKVECHVEKF